MRPAFAGSGVKQAAPGPRQTDCAEIAAAAGEARQSIRRARATFVLLFVAVR